MRSKQIPDLRIVNAIAPGVYPSEMTETTIEGAELVDEIGDTIIPVPAGRAGK